MNGAFHVDRRRCSATSPRLCAACSHIQAFCGTARHIGPWASLLERLGLGAYPSGEPDACRCRTRLRASLSTSGDALRSLPLAGRHTLFDPHREIGAVSAPRGRSEAAHCQAVQLRDEVMVAREKGWEAFREAPPHARARATRALPMGGGAPLSVARARGREHVSLAIAQRFPMSCGTATTCARAIGRVAVFVAPPSCVVRIGGGAPRDCRTRARPSKSRCNATSRFFSATWLPLAAQFVGSSLFVRLRAWGGSQAPPPAPGGASAPAAEACIGLLQHPGFPPARRRSRSQAEAPSAAASASMGTHAPGVAAPP